MNNSQYTSKTLTGKGTCPGTCGELVQGVLSNGQVFHMTCPINLFSTIEIKLEKSNDSLTNVLETGELSKTKEALLKGISLLSSDSFSIEVRSRSSIEKGKGMASSTSDIVAALRSLFNAFNENPSPEAVSKIATSIESSDGIMYPGVNVVNHKTGELLFSFDKWSPSFKILAFTPKEVVKTHQVDTRKRLINVKEYDVLLRRVLEAVEQRDLDRIAREATHSAELNQVCVQNQLFSYLSSVYKDLGAMGVNVGHSGTVVGLLYENNNSGLRKAEKAKEKIQDTLSNTVNIQTLSMDNVS